LTSGNQRLRHRIYPGLNPRIAGMKTAV